MTLTRQNTHLIALGGYRIYDPKVRQFLKKDSYSPFQGNHLGNGFNYTMGNPIIFSDTSGHMPLAAQKVIGFFAQCMGRNQQNCPPESQNAEERIKQLEAQNEKAIKKIQKLKTENQQLTDYGQRVRSKFTQLNEEHGRVQIQFKALNLKHENLYAEYARIQDNYGQLQDAYDQLLENQGEINTRSAQIRLEEIEMRVDTLSNILRNIK